jgi:hypothetical protein
VVCLSLFVAIVVVAVVTVADAVFVFVVGDSQVDDWSDHSCVRAELHVHSICHSNPIKRKIIKIDAAVNSCTQLRFECSRDNKVA